MKKLISILSAGILFLSYAPKAAADCDSCVQGCYGHCDPQVACAAACSSSVEIYTPTVRPIDMGSGYSSGGSSNYSSGSGYSGGSYSSGGSRSSSSGGCRAGSQCGGVTYHDDGGAQARVDAINAENERKWQAHKEEERRRAKIETRQAIANGIVQMTSLIAIISASRGSSRMYAPGQAPLPTFEGGPTGLVTKSNPAKDKAAKEIDEMKNDEDYSDDAVNKKLANDAAKRAADKAAEHAAMNADCEKKAGPGSVARRESLDFDGIGNGAAAYWCTIPMSSKKEPQPKPTEVKVGKQTFSKAKVDIVINTVQEKQETVQEKQKEIAHLEFKIPKFKEANKVWKEKRVDAEKKVAQAKPEDKPKRKSRLDDIIAEGKKTEELTAKYEKRREEVKADLQTAQKDLARTKNDAKGAFKDSQSLDAFNQKYEGGISGKAEIPAIDLKGLIPQKIACKENCAPTVRIWRPSADQIGFSIEAQKKFGEDSIPYADAELTLSWSGYSEDYTADEMGKMELDPMFIMEHWPGEEERVQIKAEMEGASHIVAVTKPELQHYIDSGADALIVKGDAAFKASRYDEAASRYWTSMIWKPSDKASKGWVSSMEKQGTGSSVLAAYQTALMNQAKDPQTRFQFKQKAIRLAQMMKPTPEVMPEAQEAWKKGPEAFKNGKPIQALLNEEAASSLAPWWPEPYYVMATIYEHMAVHKSFSFAQAAIENYELFLTASSGDPRASEARKGRDRLKELQEALSQ